MQRSCCRLVNADTNDVSAPISTFTARRRRGITFPEHDISFPDVTSYDSCHCCFREQLRCYFNLKPIHVENISCRDTVGKRCTVASPVMHPSGVSTSMVPVALKEQPVPPHPHLNSCHFGFKCLIQQCSASIHSVICHDLHSGELLPSRLQQQSLLGH